MKITMTNWGYEISGNFSTKSAYELGCVIEGQEVEEEKAWEKIWKLKGPGRWQFRLWLIRHERLLTNGEK